MPTTVAHLRQQAQLYLDGAYAGTTNNITFTPLDNGPVGANYFANTWATTTTNRAWRFEGDFDRVAYVDLDQKWLRYRNYVRYNDRGVAWDDETWEPLQAWTWNSYTTTSYYNDDPWGDLVTVAVVDDLPAARFRSDEPLPERIHTRELRLHRTVWEAWQKGYISKEKVREYADDSAFAPILLQPFAWEAWNISEEDKREFQRKRVVDQAIVAVARGRVASEALLETFTREERAIYDESLARWEDAEVARRQREEERAAAAAMAATEKEEARKRAEELLLKHLSPEQLRQYREHKHFDVRGGKTGTRFRVRCGTSVAGNVDVLPKKDDVRVGSLCVHTRDGYVPLPDEWLAQLLMLMYDEQAFVDMAYVHHGPRDKNELLALAAG